MRRPGVLPFLLLAALLTLLVPTPARAITPPPILNCTFTVQNIDFGNVNVITGSGLTTTGSIGIECTGGPRNGIVTICPSIRYGSGNPTAWNPRQMALSSNSAEKLNYQIYWPGTFTIWGAEANVWPEPARPPIIRVQLDWRGRASTTYPMDVRIISGQTNVAPGLYASTFSTTDTYFAYVNANVSGCSKPYGIEYPTFQVTANVIAFCEVSATDLDFGVAGLLNANVDSTGTITVRCTRGTPYTVALSGGLAGATTPDQRRMTNGANSVRYGIYRNSARTLGWGDQPTNIVSGTGTGNAQYYTTYGRVFPQTTPPPGTYTDTIVVTVTY